MFEDFSRKDMRQTTPLDHGRRGSERFQRYGKSDGNCDALLYKSKIIYSMLCEFIINLPRDILGELKK
jgi:hypothetical protein